MSAAGVHRQPCRAVRRRETSYTDFQAKPQNKTEGISSVRGLYGTGRRKRSYDWGFSHIWSRGSGVARPPAHKQHQRHPAAGDPALADAAGRRCRNMVADLCASASGMGDDRLPSPRHNTVFTQPCDRREDRVRRWDRCLRSRCLDRGHAYRQLPVLRICGNVSGGRDPAAAERAKNRAAVFAVSDDRIRTGKHSVDAAGSRR